MPLVVFKCPRLADKALDDVSVVDPMLVPAVQSRQSFGASLGIPDFEMFRENTDRHLLANQPTRHAVGVMLDANRARLADLRFDLVKERDRADRKRSNRRLFFGETF
jgi:hypothetical protein